MKTRFAEPLSPSSTNGELIDSVSLSSMVPVPVPVRGAVDTVAPDALPRVITTVSSGSLVVSPCTDTVIVWLVVPAANVSCPAGSAV